MVTSHEIPYHELLYFRYRNSSTWRRSSMCLFLFFESRIYVSWKLNPTYHLANNSLQLVLYPRFFCEKIGECIWVSGKFFDVGRIQLLPCQNLNQVREVLSEKGKIKSPYELFQFWVLSQHQNTDLHLHFLRVFRSNQVFFANNFNRTHYILVWERT